MTDFSYASYPIRGGASPLSLMSRGLAQTMRRASLGTGSDIVIPLSEVLCAKGFRAVSILAFKGSSDFTPLPFALR
jgi:hypothetical protein